MWTLTRIITNQLIDMNLMFYTQSTRKGHIRVKQNVSLTTSKILILFMTYFIVYNWKSLGKNWHRVNWAPTYFSFCVRSTPVKCWMRKHAYLHSTVPLSNAGWESTRTSTQQYPCQMLDEKARVPPLNNNTHSCASLPWRSYAAGRSRTCRATEPSWWGTRQRCTPPTTCQLAWSTPEANKAAPTPCGCVSHNNKNSTAIQHQQPETRKIIQSFLPSKQKYRVLHFKPFNALSFCHLVCLSVCLSACLPAPPPSLLSSLCVSTPVCLFVCHSVLCTVESKVLLLF